MLKGRADGLKAVLANVGQAARREYSMIEQKKVNVNVCKQIMKHYLFSAYIFTQ